MSSQTPLLETSSHHARFVISNQDKYFFAAYWHLMDLVEIGNMDLITNALKEINKSIESVGVLSLDSSSIKWMEYILSFIGGFAQDLNSRYFLSQKADLMAQLEMLELLYKLASKSFTEI